MPAFFPCPAAGLSMCAASAPDAELLNSHTLGLKLRQTEDERERDLPQK